MTTESYSYSLDGKTFYGGYTSRKEAIDEGEGDAHSAHVSGEDITSFYTARNVSVFDVMRESPILLGESILSGIVYDRLEDYLPDDSDGFKPKWIDGYTLRAKLGGLVIDFLEEHATISGGAIRDVEEHPFVA
jgi:hypothetical protein